MKPQSHLRHSWRYRILRLLKNKHDIKCDSFICLLRFEADKFALVAAGGFVLFELIAKEHACGWCFDLIFCF